MEFRLHPSRLLKQLFQSLPPSSAASSPRGSIPRRLRHEGGNSGLRLGPYRRHLLRLAARWMEKQRRVLRRLLRRRRNHLQRLGPAGQRSLLRSLLRRRRDHLLAGLIRFSPVRRYLECLYCPR